MGRSLGDRPREDPSLKRDPRDEKFNIGGLPRRDRQCFYHQHHHQNPYGIPYKN
ncbi:MAG: hypothetical protein ACFCBU_09625 [Cyanophyceae cyanobacterium]